SPIRVMPVPEQVCGRRSRSPLHRRVLQDRMAISVAPVTALWDVDVESRTLARQLGDRFDTLSVWSVGGCCSNPASRCINPACFVKLTRTPHCFLFAAERLKTRSALTA